MAEIWLAVQSGTSGFRRCVAVKKILPHLAREDAFVKMFLKRLGAPPAFTTATSFRSTTWAATIRSYFMAMEYIAGESLGDIRMRRRAEGDRSRMA